MNAEYYRNSLFQSFIKTAMDIDAEIRSRKAKQKDLASKIRAAGGMEHPGAQGFRRDMADIDNEIKNLRKHGNPHGSGAGFNPRSSSSKQYSQQRASGGARYNYRPRWDSQEWKSQARNSTDDIINQMKNMRSASKVKRYGYPLAMAAGIGGALAYSHYKNKQKPLRHKMAA